MHGRGGGARRQRSIASCRRRHAGRTARTSAHLSRRAHVSARRYSPAGAVDRNCDCRSIGAAQRDRRSIDRRVSQSHRLAQDEKIAIHHCKRVVGQLFLCRLSYVIDSIFNHRRRWQRMLKEPVDEMHYCEDCCDCISCLCNECHQHWTMHRLAQLNH
jgi:hypothetical protein